MKKLTEMIKRKLYFSSIGQRISTVMVIIIIVTVIIFMISTYNIMRYQLSIKTELNTQKDLTTVSEKMDLFFQRVKSDSILVLASGPCQDLLKGANKTLNADSSEQYRIYRLIQETMKSIFVSDDIYRTIIFYDLNANAYAPVNMAIQDKNFQIQKKIMLDFLSSSKEDAEWVTLHKSPWLFGTKGAEEDCISYLHKVYDGSSGKLIGAMEMELSTDSIFKLYKTLAQNGMDIFILDSSGMVISSENPDLRYKNFSGENWYKNFNDKKKHIDQQNKLLYMTKKYSMLDWSIVCTIPMDVYLRDLHIFSVVDIVIGLILLVIASFLSRILILSIIKPLGLITRTIHDIGKGNYEQRIRIQYGGEIGTLAVEFNRMIDKTNELMEKIVTTEQKKRESELSLIQMQMTPHFFYNILESICGLIVINEKKLAIKTVQLLSAFYRGVLNKGKDIIPISEELNIAKNYLDIMQICHSNTFTYKIHCAEELKKYHINKLTLQPILENAVHHGIIGSGRNGEIRILVSEAENKIRIRISDNGNGISAKTLESIHEGREEEYHMDSFGLKNTQERIRLHFGEDYGLSIQSEESMGTEVEILLPMQ